MGGTNTPLVNFCVSKADKLGFYKQQIDGVPLNSPVNALERLRSLLDVRSHPRGNAGKMARVGFHYQQPRALSVA